MRKKYRIFFAGAAVIILLGLAFLKKTEADRKDTAALSFPEEETAIGAILPDDTGETETSGETEAEERIVVYVSGAVREPGVYELRPGSRVRDALSAAGGFTDTAETGLVNLAETLSDGEMISFPQQGETENDPAGKTAAKNDGRVDLNHADREELMSLPGIGEKRADAIISYREQNGGFSSVEDLLLVDGIGESVLDKIRDKIKV